MHCQASRPENCSKKGAIRELQACPGAGRCETGSRRRVSAKRNEMEPSEVAVGTLGRDAAEAQQEALDRAVAAGGRLDVQSAVHLLARQAALALLGSPDSAVPAVASPSAHRCWKPSPETAPGPSVCPPWSMQVGIKCIAYACEVRTEPTLTPILDKRGEGIPESGVA